MSAPRRALSPDWRSWAGLIVGPVAWALHHQGGSNFNYADCRAWDGTAVVLTGVLALAAVLGAGGLSLSAWRRGGGAAGASHDPPGRFVAGLSLMSAALFALTILIQMAAGLLVPACMR